MTQFVAAVIGVCMGSFGNVLVDRLPAGASILGRSRCDGCRKTLSPLELVPVLSWTLLRGQCRSCTSPIPLRVPLLELFSGFLAAGCVAQVGGFPAAVALFLALWASILIAIIDLRTRMIPDALTALVLIAALAYQWLSRETIPLVPVAIGAAFFAVQWFLSRGRWVGSGDIFLAGALGALVGSVHGVVWMLILSYIIGACVAIVLMLRNTVKRGDMVPFGPFLVIAAYVAVFWGEWLPPLPLG